MHIEGTRNERVIMVLAAYAIGFTTAFIAFGVTQIEDKIQFVYVPTASQTASVVGAVSEDAAPADGTLVLNEVGLVYKDGETEELLSANTMQNGDDGFHAALIDYALSPDQQFVYFCEQPLPTSESCKPFVYSAAAKLVFPVLQNKERIALPLQQQNLTWGEGGLEAVGDATIDALPSTE